MRLGGSVPKHYQGAEQWVKDAKALQYQAATCPLGRGAKAQEIADFKLAAKSADIAIAEVGVWRNTLALDESERRDHIAYAKEQLALADELGAGCCVNISGARGEVWDGWYPDNYSADTYALVVDVTREIIDAVKPTRTFYSIEPMPWMVPDSVDSYLKLMTDINRPQFAVHMDFVNMINSVDRFLNANAFIEDAFCRLAPFIKSVHIKDVAMSQSIMPVQLKECPPGEGMLDYAHVLRVISRYLGKDAPVLLEHMDTCEDYQKAMQFVRGLAAREKLA